VSWVRLGLRDDINIRIRIRKTILDQIWCWVSFFWIKGIKREQAYTEVELEESSRRLATIDVLQVGIRPFVYPRAIACFEFS